VLSQLEAFGQHQGGGGPEHVERCEHQRLIDSPPAQERQLVQQPCHGHEDLAVMHPAARLVRRHQPGKGCADPHHENGRTPEYGAPAEACGDEQRDRPRQHDACQQAGHDIADHPATPFERHQMGMKGMSTWAPVEHKDVWGSR
jgi:hypothetical protein